MHSLEPASRPWIPFYISLLFLSITASTLAQQPPITNSTVIRTFVNGTGRPAHDLHVELSRNVHDVEGLPPGIVDEEATDKATFREVSFGGGTIVLPVSTVNVIFRKPVQPNQPVTIAFRSQAKQQGIKKWWWTGPPQKPGSPGPRISPQMQGHLRGDEGGAGKGEREFDPYSIINKRHHWGGLDRLEETIHIWLDARAFVSRAHLALLSREDRRDPQKVEEARSRAADLLKKAAHQWQACTQKDERDKVPIANEAKQGKGEKVPKNDGAKGVKDPTVMAPGPSHPNGMQGEKFRSLTRMECDAVFLKYPKGLILHVVTSNAEATELNRKARTTPFTLQGKTLVRWGGLPPNYVGLGPSKGKDETTTSAEIRMNGGKKYHLAEETDGDEEFISNCDDPPPSNKDRKGPENEQLSPSGIPKDAYDLYSILKHEIGHTICFWHLGGDKLERHNRVDDPEALEEPISSPFQELAPYPTAVGDAGSVARESVLFASDRPGGFGGTDLWSATWEGNGWQLRNLGPEVNSPSDELDPHLASDGGLLLFSSNRPGGDGGMDLYRAELDFESAQWTFVENLGPQVNSPFDERSPSMRGDMWTLLFTSDRPGGSGGFDIWRSEAAPGLGFTPATNLGAGVNSPFDESSACVSGSGTVLFLASNRPGGRGGFDLWESTYNAGWPAPKNLGKPVNTPFDELGPAIRTDHGMLTFSSDRRRGWGMELYEARMVVSEYTATPQ